MIVDATQGWRGTVCQATRTFSSDLATDVCIRHDLDLLGDSKASVAKIGVQREAHGSTLQVRNRPGLGGKRHRSIQHSSTDAGIYHEMTAAALRLF